MISRILRKPIISLHIKDIKKTYNQHDIKDIKKTDNQPAYQGY